MEAVNHDGRTTAYRRVEGGGEGPTTLYVHGSGGSHRVWVHQYGPDGPAHPAVATDLTGHGNSADFEDPPAPEDTLGAYARDVTAVADAVDADVFVGNSMGGAVVLRTILDHGVEPAGVVLAGTGPRLPVDEKLRRLLADDFDAAIDVLHGEDVLFHDADERTVERSRDTMRSCGQAVVQRDFEACHAFDVRARLDEIEAPVLAVVGEHDRLTPPVYHRTLVEEIPDCEYRELADAAHMAMVDRPTSFNEALSEFFERIR